MVYGSGPDCLGYDAAGEFPSLSEVGVVPFKGICRDRPESGVLMLHGETAGGPIVRRRHGRAREFRLSSRF